MRNSSIRNRIVNKLYRNIVVEMEEKERERRFVNGKYIIMDDNNKKTK